MSYTHIRLVALTFLAAAGVQAQEAAPRTGRVEGLVVDAETGRGIGDAGVQIVGTTMGTMTAADGSFRISNVPSGTLTIQVRRLGYQPAHLTGLILSPGGILADTIGMTQAAARVAAQIVRAAADRGSLESALEEQRTAAAIQSSVTAEQISRSPDANAAQAVQRVSGVTVQEGKYVFVRGLGERYTTTSLNGARMPSPEPEKKVVPFDLFPSGLLQSVTTTKSFTPDLPGDFSGASVDIRTREYPIERQVSYGATVGYSEGTWSSAVPFAPGVGGESFAIASSRRAMPDVARRAGDLSGIDQTGKNQIINSFRNVWRTGNRSGHPNGSFRASLGGNDRMLGRRIGYLLSGTYSYSQDLRENMTRALARPTSESSQEEKNRFTGTASGESVLWGVLMNAGTLLSANSRLGFNALYNRTADNESRVESGFFEDLAMPAEITRLEYVERSMWSSQLTGEHDRGRHGIEWAVSGSFVTRSEPDRSELIYELAGENSVTPDRRLWWNTSGEGAVRTFSTLDEIAGEAKASYRMQFGPADRAVLVKLGGLARGAQRDANTQAFGIFATIMEDSIRALPAEEIFGGRFTAPTSSQLNVRSLAQGGSYSAEDGLAAGFVMGELPLTETLTLLGGARVEHSGAVVNAISTLGERTRANKTFTDVLPSLALTYRPSNFTNVRLSVSRTLARPEYRELAGIRSRVVSGGVDFVGNPDLVRTLIDNADVRWEYYPRGGELLSAALFAKHFTNPIERMALASTTGSAVTVVNAEGANNIGVELEARKRLDFLAGWLERMSAFSSITLMRSEVQLDSARGSLTNARRAMVGQAPYVVNAGLTYASPVGGTSATLLYNRVGTRIAEAGEIPLPDVKELARDMLDLSIRFPARRGVVARIDAKNILGTPYRLTQGSVTREWYRAGRTLQLGFSVQH